MNWSWPWLKGVAAAMSKRRTPRGAESVASKAYAIEMAADVDQGGVDGDRSTDVTNVERGPLEDQTRTEVLELLRLLRPMKAVGVSKVRVGSVNDGGYIMLDDMKRASTAFSFGVEHNADWDLDMAERGIKVLQFDHTIVSAPIAHPRISWTKKRIAGIADDAHESIHSLVVQTPGSEINLILKLDIEHDEWPVFDATPVLSLKRFRQIVGEFHGFNFLADDAWRERMTRVFRKLTQSHAIVHVHANNYCGTADICGVTIPAILELTFANRAIYQFEPTQETFPGPLDSPRDGNRPDIILGPFHF